jgi:hypothetical protein
MTYGKILEPFNGPVTILYLIRKMYFFVYEN